jgi:hypothetical protein
VRFMYSGLARTPDSQDSNYLEDGRVFFEFVYNQFSKKIFGSGSVEKTETLGSYNPQYMGDFKFVLEDVKSKLKKRLASEI